MLLVRIMIGKVVDRGRLAGILRKTPLRQGTGGWNCVLWIKEALEKIQADGKALGSSVTAWEKVRVGAMVFCENKKAQHRFDGKGNFDMTKIATYDLMESKEIIP